jgi:hypothetical protein
MGAGGPIKVDGGMDEASYARLQQEEREFLAAQEERQMGMMNDMEDARVARQEAEIQRQDRVRENEANALENMESQLSDNVEAINTDLEEEDNDIVLDFYNSLQEGGERPE